MQVRIPLILGAALLPLVVSCTPTEPTKPAGNTPAPAAQTPPPAPKAPATPVAMNGFTYVDSFESYATGTDVLGKNGWATGSSKPAAGVFTVQVDPANPANKALRIDKLGDESRLRALNSGAAIVIAPKTTGTFFFRVRTEGDKAIDVSLGHGDAQAEPLANKPPYGDHRIQYVLHARALEVRGSSDGSPIEGISASELAPATWYSVWLVVNNTARTYDVYMQGGATAQTKVITAVPFRATSDIKADQPLDRFFITVDNESPGTAFLDDLCIDRTKSNLANPLAK